VHPPLMGGGGPVYGATGSLDRSITVDHFVKSDPRKERALHTQRKTFGPSRDAGDREIAQQDAVEVMGLFQFLRPWPLGPQFPSQGGTSARDASLTSYDRTKQTSARLGMRIRPQL